jgi:hypothetical protein
MSFEFNADEILEMAEQIERNGARFYRKAAELVKDAAVSKLLQDCTCGQWLMGMSSMRGSILPIR